MPSLDDPPTDPPSRVPSFGMLLVLSFIVFNAGPILDATVRWSNHLDGFFNGLFHMVLWGPAWVVLALPLNLLVAVLYRWCKWRRFRSAWTLAPGALVILLALIGFVLNPPTPRHRFERFAQAPFPSDARVLDYRFSGGGLADYYDRYHLATSPGSISGLVAAMRLTESEEIGSDVNGLIKFHSGILDGEDPTRWKDGTLYTRPYDNGLWFYYLLANADRTRAIIVIGCI